ncbi:MAG: hypothetical protein Q8P16_00970, partial [bacterium]|nr:hypothetical protein [bacterium]
MTKSILAILFLGASVLVFVFYIRPTYDTVQENRAKAEEFDRALEKTREIQELKSSLLNRYNLFVTENLDRLQKMLPDHVDNVRLVLDMDGIASAYGIRIQNVIVQRPGQAESQNQQGGTILVSASQGRPYQSLTLQFEVVATYDEFVRLVRDLEASLRIVDVV